MRLFIFVIPLMAGCSTTVTGPVTGKQYNLEIGCTDNMQSYKRDREAVLGKTSADVPPEVIIDCPAAPE